MVRNRTFVGRVSVATASLVALATLAAACGSSSNSSSKGGQLTKSAIKLMTIYPADNPSNSEPEVLTSAQAAADYINRSGGINGHPLQVIGCNSFFNAQGATTCYHQAVSDGVVAVIGSDDAYDYTGFPILQAAGIADIGTIPFGGPDATNTDSFPVIGGTPVQMTTDGIIAGTHCKLTSEVIIDVPVGVSSAGFATAGIKSKGGKVGNQVKYAPTTSDFAPIAQQAIQGNPDCIYFVGANQQSPSLVQNIRQLGSQAHMVAAPAEIAEAVGGDGMLYADMVPPPQDPSLKTYLTTLKAYAGAHGESLNQGEITGDGPENAWTSFIAFEAVMKNQTQFTASSVLSAFGNASNVNTGGLTPTLTWKTGCVTKFPRLANTVGYMSQVQGGQQVPLPPGHVDVCSALNAAG